MIDELKPCPFCGEVANGENTVVVTETARSGPRFGVRCYRCGGRVEFFENIDEAIIAWNCRHEPRQATLSDLYGIWKEPDYLCDMCANDCDERREIRVGQGAYDVCERWEEMRDEGTA